MQSARVRAVRDAASAAASGPESATAVAVGGGLLLRLELAESSRSCGRAAPHLLVLHLGELGRGGRRWGAREVGKGARERGGGGGGGGGGHHLLGEAPEASLQRVFV